MVYLLFVPQQEDLEVAGVPILKSPTSQGLQLADQRRFRSAQAALAPILGYRILALPQQPHRRAA
jgi:hypothetical protein